MHEGKTLKKLIFEKELEITQVAKKSGISRPQLYLMFKMQQIPEKYYPKLKKAGIDFEKVKFEDVQFSLDSKAEAILYRAKYEEAVEKISKLTDIIIDLNTKLKQKK